MRKKSAFRVSGLVFLLVIPYLAVMGVNGAEAAFLNRAAEPEEFVAVLTAMQIPDTYEKETIKAQAVIARTNLFRQAEDGDTEKVLDELQGEIREKGWGFWDPVYGQAAKETEGQVLTSNGELKQAPYHELSGGETRDGESAFHDGAYAYLRAVDSGGDKDSPEYLSSTYIAGQRLPAELKVEERDTGGYVISLRADGNLLEGETFARGMGLKSSNFTIQRIGDQVRILVKGRGHGLGFSQYGGDQMAKNGNGWREILEKYFPGMEITEYEKSNPK